MGEFKPLDIQSNELIRRLSDIISREFGGKLLADGEQILQGSDTACQPRERYDLVGYISRAGTRVWTLWTAKLVATSPNWPGDIGAETPQWAQDKANKVKDDVANGRISIPRTP
ncbi:hypothetical protein P7H17_26670 [Paenibacillus larvae]|nr:hypothetical protein [Paenibacillus larvae]MDT2288918.1 hypothetical protein [Paenibacillus larvae]